MNLFALLLALLGAAIYMVARSNPERMAGPYQWARPPTWLLFLVRRGSGPVGVMTLAFEAYGFGMAILGVAAGLTGSESGVIDLLLAGWLLGGMAVLGVIDGLQSIRSHMR